MATPPEVDQDQILLTNGPHNIPSTSKIQKMDRAGATTSNYLPISQFYAGRSVFITGGTGFMGKVSISIIFNII